MEKDIFNYLIIPEVHQTDEYLYKFLKKHPSSFSLVNEERIINLDDLDLITEIIQASQNTRILENKKIPKKWIEDKDFLLKIGSHLRNCYSEKILKTIYKSIDIAKEFVSLNEKFYRIAPIEFKLNHDFALLAVKSDFEILKALYQSKEFCLKAMQHSSKEIAKVPESFFSDKEFLKEMCALIKEKKIWDSIFANAPVKIKSYFASFNIERDYAEFLEKSILKQSLTETFSTKTETIKKQKI
jgi:hypothetical protein